MKPITIKRNNRLDVKLMVVAVTKYLAVTLLDKLDAAITSHPPFPKKR